MACVLKQLHPVHTLTYVQVGGLKGRFRQWLGLVSERGMGVGTGMGWAVLGPVCDHMCERSECCQEQRKARRERRIRNGARGEEGCTCVVLISLVC